MKYKFLVILHYLILLIIVASLGNFYPSLESMPNDSVQQGAIRLLASLLYFGDQGAWIQLIIVTVIITIIAGIGCMIKLSKEFSSYAKSLIFIQGLLWFFYWQFTSKYAPIFYQGISQQFFLAFLLQIGTMAGIILLVWMGMKIKSKIFHKNHIMHPSIARFQCPHCQRIYLSSVTFCLTCQRTIDPILLPSPNEK